MARCALLKTPELREWAESKVRDLRSGDIKQGEMRELERLGILIKETVSGDSHSSAGLPQYCNQSEFADILNERFGRQSGKTYVPMDVTRLKEKWKAQPWFEEVFLKNGSVRPSQGLRRFEESEAGQGGSTLAARDDAITRRQIAAAAREVRANEEESRKMDARWILEETLALWCISTATHMRQSMLAEHNKFLGLAKTAGKESGMDDVSIEKQQTLLRPKMESGFESWQADFSNFAEDLDKTVHELNEQKKSELKVKKP